MAGVAHVCEQIVAVAQIDVREQPAACRVIATASSDRHAEHAEHDTEFVGRQTRVYKNSQQCTQFSSVGGVDELIVAVAKINSCEQPGTDTIVAATGVDSASKRAEHQAKLRRTQAILAAEDAHDRADLVAGQDVPKAGERSGIDKRAVQRCGQSGQRCGQSGAQTERVVPVFSPGPRRSRDAELVGVSSADDGPEVPFDCQPVVPIDCLFLTVEQSEVKLNTSRRAGEVEDVCAAVIRERENRSLAGRTWLEAEELAATTDTRTAGSKRERIRIRIGTAADVDGTVVAL